MYVDKFLIVTIIYLQLITRNYNYLHDSNLFNERYNIRARSRKQQERSAPCSKND